MRTRYWLYLLEQEEFLNARLITNNNERDLINDYLTIVREEKAKAWLLLWNEE